jgi:hypothetical protein
MWIREGFFHRPKDFAFLGYGEERDSLFVGTRGFFAESDIEGAVGCKEVSGEALGLISRTQRLRISRPA